MRPHPLLRPALRNLAALTPPPAAPGLLRMDANTNLIGPNPAVRRALARLAGEDLTQYPAADHSELRTTLAKRFGLNRDEVLVGAGIDELIDVIVRAFVDPGHRVAVVTPTFELFEHSARVSGARIVRVPLDRFHRFDPGRLLRAKARVTYVASPNNPTGDALDVEDLELLIRRSRGLVVVDEAYAEYGGQDFARRVRHYSNLIILRTFSKAYGLAGLRVGYALSSRSLIDAMERVKVPFTVSRVSERIALEALKSDEFVRRTRRMIAKERPRLEHALRGLGLVPSPGCANFLYVLVGPDARRLTAYLERRGILVKALAGSGPVKGHIRVTVGRREHSKRLVREVKRYLHGIS